uniref:Disease resistance N-terminal domain-containing protein n=2 Tax=Aegilops tauschii subsp. strangulata TaxID=200361 RepID=A0A453GKD4_AEGTS
HNLILHIRRESQGALYLSASLAVANTSFWCKRARARCCCDAMAEVAGMIASAVGNQVASKLGELVKDEIALLWGFEDDVEGLREKMEDLQALLLDADERMRRGEIQGKAVSRWLAKFKDVAYDVEDVLDDLDATALVEKTQSKVIHLLVIFVSRGYRYHSTFLR